MQLGHAGLICIYFKYLWRLINQFGLAEDMCFCIFLHLRLVTELCWLLHLPIQHISNSQHKCRKMKLYVPHYNSSSFQHFVNADKCRFPLVFFYADSFFVIYLHLVNVSTPHLFSILYGQTSAGFFLCVLFVYYFYLFCFWKDNRVVKSNFLMQQQMLPVQTLHQTINILWLHDVTILWYLMY